MSVDSDLLRIQALACRPVSGASPKRKGDRLERAVVTTLKEHGLEAKRVPLSGAVAGFEGDVIAIIAGKEWNLECKSRADGFKQLYGWLESRDGLIIKADRREPLAVMRLQDLLELIEPGGYGGA